MTSGFNRPADDELDTQLTIIEMAKGDDPEAWNTVTSLYSPLIRHWAWKKGVRCPHDLDNVNQEVFKRVYHKLHTFSKPEGKGSFRGWLRTITHNFIYSNQLAETRLKIDDDSQAVDILNNFPSPKAEKSLLDSSVEDSGAIESGLIFRRIMNWVRKEYSPVQAAAFTGVVVHQRPARDVADELKISVNVVYQTKCRILKRIREVFKDIV